MLRDEPALRECGGESCALGREPEIAHHREHESAARCDAVDCRDDGLWNSKQVAEQRRQFIARHAGIRLLPLLRTRRRRASEVAGVEAGAECPAGSGDDDTDYALIGGGALHGVADRVDHAERERVELLRTVELHQRDGILDLESHLRTIGVHDATLPASFARRAHCEARFEASYARTKRNESSFLTILPADGVAKWVPNTSVAESA